jgi:hypothetical protein
MLTCHDARALIVRTIDDPRLPGDARATLRAHLAVCASCREEYETQHEVRRVLALHIEDPLPAGFAERLNARLAQETRLADEARLAQEALLAEEARLAPVARLAEESRPALAARFAEEAMPQASAPAPAPRVARWRTWGPLLPIAATLALIVADTQLRPVAPPVATPSPLATAVSEPPLREMPTPAPTATATATQRRQGSRQIRSSQATNVASQPVPSSAQSAAQAPAGALQRHEAAADPKAPATVTPDSPVAWLPIVPAPELAEALKLSDTQRKEIDAAIERVLTPDQRRLYRERQANSAGPAGERPHASERSGVLPRPAVPVPPAQQPPPLPPPW